MAPHDAKRRHSLGQLYVLSLLFFQSVILEIETFRCFRQNITKKWSCVIFKLNGLYDGADNFSVILEPNGIPFRYVGIKRGKTHLLLMM